MLKTIGAGTGCTVQQTVGFFGTALTALRAGTLLTTAGILNSQELDLLTKSELQGWKGESNPFPAPFWVHEIRVVCKLVHHRILMLMPAVARQHDEPLMMRGAAALRLVMRVHSPSCRTQRLNEN